MIYWLQDEFVEETALQMSADKQGSQIIEAIKLKVLQLIICHSAPRENVLLSYRCSGHISSQNITSGKMFMAAQKVHSNLVQADRLRVNG
jgi:hypothetical protein